MQYPHFQPGQQRGPEPRGRLQVGRRHMALGQRSRAAGCRLRCHQPPSLLPPAAALCKQLRCPSASHSALSLLWGMHADPGRRLLPPPRCRWCRTMRTLQQTKGTTICLSLAVSAGSLPCWGGGRRKAEHHPKGQFKPKHNSQTRAHGKRVTVWRD